ncbi:MAG: hypothetical protein F6J87_00995, partial [Spirulina sp. SIO3F2]|nr:hypothetical protein [Spirulina sp. SIO3F2]
LNLAVIGAVIQPRVTAAITLGAIGPDLPIFVFYAWAKFIQRFVTNLGDGQHGE